MKVGVLVVAYNAETTIAATLDRIPTTSLPELAEVLVLDDHSSDRTVREAERFRDEHPDVPFTVLRQPKNLGYGGNQKSGYRYAADHGWDVVVMVHGDGQYAPERLPWMVAPFADPDVAAVFGSRMQPSDDVDVGRRGALRGGMPIYKYVGNRILTRSQNWLTGAHLSEWHSGYRAYRVDSLAAIDFEANSDGFDFDTEIILQLLAGEHPIVEIPIPTFYGDETCHVNGMAYARDILVHSLRFRLGERGFGRGQLGQVDPDHSYRPSPKSAHGRVLAMMQGRPPSKVLDVGCGPGWLAAELRRQGHYVVGVDAMEHPSVRSRTDDFMQADIDVGLPDEVLDTYDVVIAANVLGHVREPELLMRHLAECVADHGRLLASVPNISHWYSRGRVALGLFNYDQRGILDRSHLRFFTRRSFVQLVRRSSLTPVSTSHSGLPLDLLLPTRGGLVGRIAGRVDDLLVRVRPTLFAYQFVYELAPKRGSASGSVDLLDAAATEPSPDVRDGAPRPTFTTSREPSS